MADDADYGSVDDVVANFVGSHHVEAENGSRGRWIAANRRGRKRKEGWHWPCIYRANNAQRATEWQPIVVCHWRQCCHRWPWTTAAVYSDTMDALPIRSRKKLLPLANNSFDDDIHRSGPNLTKQKAKSDGVFDLISDSAASKQRFSFRQTANKVAERKCRQFRRPKKPKV